MAHPVGPFKVRKMKGQLGVSRWHVIDTRKGNSVEASVDNRTKKQSAQVIADVMNLELLKAKGLAR